MKGYAGAMALMVAGAALLGVAACDDAAAFTEPVASIAVSPAVGLHTGVLVVGDTLTLTAVTRGASGEPLIGRPVLWVSSDSTVARVSQSGLVTARAVGNVQIRASAEGRTGQMGLGITTVSTGNVALVTASPTANVMQVGGTRQYTARAFDANGAEIVGAVVIWTALPAGVVSVTGQGLVTAVGPGYGEIRATVEGVSFTSAVTVETPVP